MLGQLNQAREYRDHATALRARWPDPPNRVEIVREDTITTTTTLSSVLIEGGAQFALLASLPDTPDEFGISAAIEFGSATNVKFTPEGTLVNQDGQPRSTIARSWRFLDQAIVGSRHHGPGIDGAHPGLQAGTVELEAGCNLAECLQEGFLAD